MGMRLRRFRAAVVRAIAIVATAGALRAVAVVVAFARIGAASLLAGSARIAIVVTAAIGAVIVLLAEAAEQPIATVVLPRSVRGKGHLTAHVSGTLAAGAERHTIAVATFLALAAPPHAHVIGAVRAVWAVGIAAAFAGLAVAVFAIPELAVALIVFTAECAVRAGFAFAAAEMVRWAFWIDGTAFIVRDALALAAASSFDAMIGADTQVAK